jgi:hypothetical protein
MAERNSTRHRARKTKEVAMGGNWTNDECPEERTGTRIRAFLAKVKPLVGSVGENDTYLEGRALIEGLALAWDLESDGHHWDSMECATVLTFLHWIQPVKGSCFCDDNSRVNATCGFHAILKFMADQLHRLAPQVKGRKRAA